MVFNSRFTILTWLRGCGRLDWSRGIPVFIQKGGPVVKDIDEVW